MEINERRVLELFLGLVFIALLIAIVLLVIYLPRQEKTYTTSNIISNSYNTNSFNEYDLIETQNRGLRDFDNFDRKYYYEKRDLLNYQSYGKHSREKTFFDNYRDEFRVYVVNKDYQGGYFEVEFYFCNYYDDCFSETMKKYISAGDEREFYYVDIHEGKYDYYNWEYKVFPDKSD